jgi:Uma2 family endonuclease
MEKQKPEVFAKRMGFYENLIVKPKENKQEKAVYVCDKIGNVKKIINKKYMIPSQFPNITKMN